MARAKKSLYSPHPLFEMEASYAESLLTKTGRTLDEWAALVKKDGPPDEKQRRAWLKEKHGLSTNYCWWVVERANGEGGAENYDPEALVAAMFDGKATLMPLYDTLLRAALALGKDIKACPCKTIVPLYRKHVFAELKPATKTRLELNLALFDAPFTPRLIDSGGTAKGDRLTHRVKVTAPGDIDGEVLGWLRKAYELGAEERAPRKKPDVAAPADLLEAIGRAGLTGVWEKLPPSHRREHSAAVVEAKKPETRGRRIEKALEMLRTRRPAAS